MDLTITNTIAALRLQHSPTGVTTDRKEREHWAIVLKRQGKTYYTAKGETLLSDELHPVLLPKGCSYSWTCTEAGECLLIEFDALETLETPLSFSITDPAPLLKGFAKIEKELSFLGELHAISCKQQLYEMLVFLFKSAKKEYVDQEKRNRLKPAIDRITHFYWDPTITNDRLAERCGISTVYFRKLFESVYGVSPIKYLHHLRTAKARSMLESDYGSIGQIAESVGYRNLYHFSKMFRIYNGVSPSEYARATRGAKK